MNLEDLLKNYQPSEAAKGLIAKTPILLLVGPSGAGKDAVKNRLMQTGRFYHIVSHTTRKPRVNNGIPEQNGQPYYFIDEAAATQMLKDAKFVEAKIYSNNLYGTSVSEIENANRQGKVAMTDLEVQGVAEYKAVDPDVMAVFLLPPDFQTWLERLHRRYGNTIDQEDYVRRAETALKELEELLNTDHYIPVVNGDLDKTVETIQRIMFSGAKPEIGDQQAEAVAQKLVSQIRSHLQS
jgi:guanylate kinase